VGAELFQSGRRTDRYDETNSLFPNYANARKNIVTIEASDKLCFASAPLVTSETVKSKEPIGMSKLPAIRWLHLCPDDTDNGCLRNFVH